MIISDQQREENYQEYLRLVDNPDYFSVTYDEQSGGVSAMHRNHKFDSEIGAFGVKIGEYEKNVLNLLRERGHFITLESELAPIGIKTPDGRLDESIMDIKSIDGTGKWAVKDKFHSAAKQGAECVILYFHKKDLYSAERVLDGWNKYLNDESSKKWPMCIKKVICAVEQQIIYCDLP